MADQPKDPKTGKFLPKAAAAEPTTKAEPQPTKENLDAMQELSRRFAGSDEPAKPAEPKKPEEPVKPAAAKPTPKKPEPSPTAAALERTTKALETVVSKLDKPEPKKEEPKPDADPLKDLDPSERRTVNVLKQMEKDFGDRYKGISDKYIAGQKALAAYAAKWETDHPGQEFDAEAPEHETFFTQNNVDWDDEDYGEAKDNLKLEPYKNTQAQLEEQAKKLNEELSELKRARKADEELPKIGAEQVSAAKNFWTEYGDEYKDMVKEGGELDSEKLATLHKPSEAKIIIDASMRAASLTGEMYKLLNGLTLYDQNNQVHSHLINFGLDMEKKMLSQPADVRRDKDGREFKTRKEYRALSEEDRNKYWTFSTSDFGFMLAKTEAAKAKAILKQRADEFKAWAEERGIKVDDSAPENGATPSRIAPKGEDDDDPDALPARTGDNGKPRSPSSAPVPKVAAVAAGNVPQSSDPVVSFIQKQFAKS